MNAQNKNVAQIYLPKKIAWIHAKPSRYKGAWGGRGSGKSLNFAQMAALRGTQKPIRILCARELQNSIKDSVHHEVVNAIEASPYLDARYECGVSYIRGKNGTEFLFKGLRQNYRDIKSTSGVSICWVEEAETVAEESWRVLTPTIRAPGSEIWLTWNPESEDSATHNRYILNPPDDFRVSRVNYQDNPWFPPELEQERLRDLKLDPDMYQHVWEGECITRSDAQVMSGKWIIDEFKEPINANNERLYDGPYYGSDFGFSQDPTTLIRCYIYSNKLFITHDTSNLHGREIEAGIGVDSNEIVRKLYSRIPEFDKHKIRADCARPETISYLRKENGLDIIGADKWKGSVEDGISFLRSFDEIVIHPRCRGVAREMRLYSYKIDRLSGDVMRDIVDANNHYIDALRYALDPMIQSKGGSFSLLSNMDI